MVGYLFFSLLASRSPVLVGNSFPTSLSDFRKEHRKQLIKNTARRLCILRESGTVGYTLELYLKFLPKAIVVTGSK